MSEMITTSGRSINTITAEIITITAQTNQMVVMNAIEVGRRLVEAKALVPHGEWGEYLRQEVSFSKSTANNLMKIFREYGDKQINSQALGNLPYTKMVRLLAVPEEEREEFAIEHDVEHISTRELEQAIKDRDAARDLLAVAQESATAAEQKADDLQKQANRLSAALDQSNKDAKKAQADLAKLKKDAKAADARIEQAKKDAYEQARKEYQDQLDAAHKAVADAAAQARAEAEQSAEAAQKELDNARRAEKMADPDAIAFSALFKQIQESFNMLNGYLLKFRGSKPELAESGKAAVAAMLEQWKEQVA